MARTGIGVVGVGDISGAYLRTFRLFDQLEVVACAALHLERAQARAAEFGIPRACTLEELLADPAVDIVVNLTVPNAHYEIARRALEAGKSVYNEKPLALTREQGAELLALASTNGLRIGCAPDTFLGAGLQTCRRLIDEGAIGQPVAATAFMLCHGHESWHPSPEFYYQVGGGPLFDMGPYYLTALVSLLGPVRRVSGAARATFPERTITSEPRRGQVVRVEVPTHVAGVLELEVGAIATLVTSFDVWSSNVPLLEIYGTEGTLSVPDPNTFGGPVRLRKATELAFRDVRMLHGYAENSRGLGTADMAAAIL
ncbi:MAG TPA: Gfo/Idh/MocA family oxidoreductase, partial [Longimicrobiales bacterium]